jgi:hypothetical protein
MYAFTADEHCKNLHAHWAQCVFCELGTEFEIVFRRISVFKGLKDEADQLYKTRELGRNTQAHFAAIMKLMMFWEYMTDYVENKLELTGSLSWRDVGLFEVKPSYVGLYDYCYPLQNWEVLVF